jgi:hypothetical protein
MLASGEEMNVGTAVEDKALSKRHELSITPALRAWVSNTAQDRACAQTPFVSGPPVALKADMKTAVRMVRSRKPRGGTASALFGN